MTTGEKIRDERIHQQLTQRELAELSGVNIYTISQIENDIRKNIHRDTMAVIAKALGVTPESLIGDRTEDLADILNNILKQLKRIATAMEKRK